MHTVSSRRAQRELGDGRTRGLHKPSSLADLTEAQLDTVPPASEMKFCDGQRTLQQVVTNLLIHQSHQLDALRTAIT